MLIFERIKHPIFHPQYFVQQQSLPYERTKSSKGYRRNITISILCFKVVQNLCILQPDDAGHAIATFFWWLFLCRLTSWTNILTAKDTNMPATTVEDWLRSDRADGPPHRCRKIVKEWESEDGAFVTCRADDGTQQTHKLVAMSSLSRRACYK